MNEKELLTQVDGNRHTFVNTRVTDLWYSDNEYSRSMNENRLEVQKIKRSKIPWYPKQIKKK